MTALNIRHLTAGYGKQTVLLDISLPTISSSQVVGVLGPNAAGKSTLLRTLAGFLDYRGTVGIDDTDLTHLDHAARARLIGYLPQALPQTTSLVAYEAVFSACRAVQPDLTKADAEAAVADAFNRLGIRDIAFKALDTLSGGQRQMVGLAQVAVRRPRVLLLDEPTSALDLRWQLGVFRTVRDIIAETGGLCLIALHDINLAMRHCDTLMVLTRGEVLSYGTPAEAITPRTISAAYAVDGRVETCSKGKPFVMTDGALPGISNI